MSADPSTTRGIEGGSPFPIAPQPPKSPMARACSVGSTNTLTRSASAEGMVIAAAMPLNARRMMMAIFCFAKPAPTEMTPSTATPPVNATLGLYTSEMRPLCNPPLVNSLGVEGQHNTTHNKEEGRKRQLEGRDDPCRLGLVDAERVLEVRDGGEERGVVDRIEELCETEDEQENIAARGRVFLRDAAVDEGLCG